MQLESFFFLFFFSLFFFFFLPSLPSHSPSLLPTCLPTLYHYLHPPLVGGRKKKESYTHLPTYIPTCRLPAIHAYIPREVQARLTNVPNSFPQACGGCSNTSHVNWRGGPQD
ncbi:hypothetical protein F4775DRAFT_541525 [Biscogniauxia sp. FL1348]|nr:hypothetical protein F4775DRAFT_541525 [Biscogniauxia sp. FL1348]